SYFTRTIKAVHEWSLNRFGWYNKYWQWHYHRHVHLAIGLLSIITIAAVIFSQIQGVLALSTWTQTDWSGGVGTSTVNQYASQNNLSTSNSGEVDMASNNLILSGNEINDNNRNTLTQGDGLNADDSFGIWEPTTNMIGNGGAESAT